jgi:hypothetical protein
MSNPGDPQDQAEALDTDKLPGGYDDPLIEPEYPLDELMGADEYGLTAAEERVDEPLEERVGRENPEPLATVLDEQLAEDDGRSDGTSLTAELDDVEFSLSEEDQDLARGVEVPVGIEAELDDLEPVGRLAEPGTDDDVTEFIDNEAESVGVATPEDDLSAEEAAIHLTADPPMGRPGGGYVD